MHRIVYPFLAVCDSSVHALKFYQLTEGISGLVMLVAGLLNSHFRDYAKTNPYLM